jgi:hypothetical protein
MGKTKEKRVRPALSAQQRLALAVGGVGCFVLLLSVWECTLALNSLTGLPLPLAGLLAVGIDFGMVVSELASVVSQQEQKARLWAERYVGLAVALSVVLNSVAAASHTTGWMVVVALAVGGVVPVLVYIAGRTAGSLSTGG